MGLSPSHSEVVSACADNNQPSTSRDADDLTQDDDAEPKTFTPSGAVTGSWPGENYQLKQVAFTLVCLLEQKNLLEKDKIQQENPSFHLATEMVEAEKFDDLFVRYKNGSGKQIGRFVQIKHRSNQKAMISAQMLLDADGDFSLSKYFKSWCKVKNKPLFSKLDSRNIILCTDAGIESQSEELVKNDISFVKTEEPDELFKIENTSKTPPAWYKFKANRASNARLYDKLKETSDLIALAKRLATDIFQNKPIRLEVAIIKQYHIALMEHVFHAGEKKFRVEAMKKAGSSQKFLEILVSEYKKLSKHDSDDKAWGDFIKQSSKLCEKIRQDFWNSPTLVLNPHLADREVIELSDRFEELLKNAADSRTIKIEAAEKLNKVIIDNLDKLSGHVLIEDNRKKIRFRPQFLKGKQLPDSIGKFRDALKGKLQNNCELDEFEFNLQKYKVCTEEQFLTEGKLPNDKVDDEDITEFLEEFSLAVNQPNNDEISQEIARKLVAIGRFAVPPTELLSDAFENRVRDCFIKGSKQSNKTEYIRYEVGKTILDGLDDEVRSLINTGACTKYYHRLKAFDLRFNAEFEMPSVQNLLTAKDTNDRPSHRILQLVAPEQTLLTTLRLHDTLERISEQEKPRGFIFIELDHFELQFVTKTVIPAFKSQENLDLLLLDCRLAEVEKYTAELWVPLYKIVETNSNKKIILITQTDTCLRTSFITCYKVEDHSNYSFGNLTYETQKKLLKKPLVIFQGHRTSFWELLDIGDPGSLEEIELKNPSEMIDSSTLLDLICGNELQICDNLEVLDKKDCYMHRKIRHVTIGETILETDEEYEVFAISGAHGENSETSQDPPKITYLRGKREEEDFNALCNKYATCNIHWLEKNSELAEYIWKKSHGKITHLATYRKFRNDDVSPATSPTMSEGQLVALNGPVIISDSAGMGKSLLLSHLASNLKKKHPNMLVIKINLSQHITDFEEVRNRSGNIFSRAEALEFLVEKLLSSETGLGRKVARRIIEEKSKVALIFDSFDEIMNRHTEQTVLNLLGALVEHGIRNLFVATRPETKTALENKLQVLSYEVQPFSRKKQEKFLVNLWKLNLNPRSNKKIDERMQIYAEAILTKVAASIGDRINEFAGIPLHTKLVAEIFQIQSPSLGMDFDSCDKFVQDTTSSPSLPDKINLGYLYEHFVEKKFDVFVTPLEKTDFKHSFVKALREREYHRYINIHEKLALNAIFHEEKVRQILLHPRRRNRSLSEETDRNVANERSGLITRFDDHGRPEFGHKTYAEYFAAKFLTDILKSGQVSLPVRRIIEQQVLMKNKYETMRAFINCLLEEKSGRFSGKVWEFHVFGNERNPTLSPTIFHKAVIDHNEHIFRFFFNHLNTNSENRKAVFDVKNYTGMNLLFCAARWGRLWGIKLLVAKGADVNCTDDDGRTPLHAAASLGKLDVVKSLVDAGAIVNCKDEHRFTPLHLAACSDNNSDVVRYLLKKEADIHSKDKIGVTALHRAGSKNCSDVARILLEAGANVNSKECNGDTPLHMSLDNDWGIRTERKHNLVDREFFYTKFKVMFDTKLIASQRADDLDPLKIVKIFILHNANVNSENKYLNRPLHYAALNCKLDVIKYLVDNGAIVNCANKYRVTPLHAAALTGKLDVVKYLVKNEADIYSAMSSGEMPRAIAAARGHWDVAEYLREVEYNNRGSI